MARIDVLLRKHLDKPRGGMLQYCAAHCTVRQKES